METTTAVMETTAMDVESTSPSCSHCARMPNARCTYCYINLLNKKADEADAKTDADADAQEKVKEKADEVKVLAKQRVNKALADGQTPHPMDVLQSKTGQTSFTTQRIGAAKRQCEPVCDKNVGLFINHGCAISYRELARLSNGLSYDMFPMAT